MPVRRDRSLTSVLRRWANIPERIICILVLLFQCAILDYYMISHNTLIWCLWALPDLIVVGIFIWAFIVSYRYLRRTSDSEPMEGGELPLGYVAWGVYAVFLCCKVAIIFGMPEYIAQKLDEKSGFFGVNLLKTTISLSAIIYLLLVASHNDAAPDSNRQALIKSLSGGIAVDILDTVQFLNLLFIQETRIFLTFTEHRAILGVSCINLLLPTLLLVILSRTRYGRGNYPRGLKLLHTTLYLIFINLPMLVIRILLWHLKSQDVSVFAIKNVIGIGQTVINIHEHMVALTPADSPAEVDPGSSPDDPTSVAMVPLRPATSASGPQEATTEL
ncbi:hypothetical protein CAPTEDRAFT_219189 [Capitella teleta]|uniref:Uncharacterized protein n=1 Tax=Capitella teleta TaxID=283909 RepID=R7VGY8_CAPTE|nr:hypothetical protein CAPTEDRAFT_219189 [Capitella teleta]|eukprot:ELU17874.1 hypothetical protein CAPTEDRAFT_219189 [Capitella teleta]